MISGKLPSTTGLIMQMHSELEAALVQLSYHLQSIHTKP
jgi:hypothetical protein